MQRKNNDCEKWIWKINKISLLVRMAFKIWMHWAWNKQEQSYISAISIWYKDYSHTTYIKMILQFNICWIIIFISWLRQQIRCKRYIAIARRSRKFITSTIGIFRRNEYIPYGNDLVPYENAFIPRGNELIPTSCWNLHKPKLPKIKTF